MLKLGKSTRKDVQESLDGSFCEVIKKIRFHFFFDNLTFFDNLGFLCHNFRGETFRPTEKGATKNTLKVYCDHIIGTTKRLSI